LRGALLFAASVVLLVPGVARSQDGWAAQSPGPERAALFAKQLLAEHHAADGTLSTAGRNAGSRRHLVLMAAGFATSIAAHEAGHVAAALAVGGKPSFGFDNGRPVVYSGIDPVKDPDKQLLFSGAGLAVQIVMDELLLDIPRGRAGSFERGVLAGGITTGLFYALLGRNSSVSDVNNIAETSGLSKATVGVILGSISVLHVVRVVRGERFADFFAAPGTDGELRISIVVGGH
jgi:hypothetical protein